MSDPRSIVVHKTLHAPRARVFEAWRRAELLSRWFSAPGWTASVTNDFRVGGRYRIDMRDAAGHRHAQFGRYEVIEPVERLVFTWTCRELEVEDSVVTVELEDRGMLTELTLTHVLPPDRELRRLHEEGWHRCFGQLDRVLADFDQGETR